MDDIRRVRVNGVRWRLREDVADFLLDAGALDVWTLAKRPEATLVKKGVHRMVFRVSLPRGDDETLDLFVKVFLLPRARDVLRYMVRSSHGEREWRAGERLEAIGVPSARRVAVGERRVAGVLREDYIITEAVPDVVPLDDFIRETLPKMPADERGQLVRRAAPVLAAFVRVLHDHGVLHHDFHAGNVLLKTEPDGTRRLMLIDLHAVAFRRMLSLGRRLDNLTQFNRFFSMHVSRTARLRFWKTYVRGIPFLEANRGEYARLLADHTADSRERFWRRRERYCLGTNRGFRRFHVQGARGHTVRGRVEIPGSMLARLPDDGMTMPDAMVIKDSASTRIWEQRIDFGSEVRTVVVKQKRRRGTGAWRFLRSFLRDVGALREWRVAYAMKLRGLPVVEMLAAWERRRLGVVDESVLVMAKVADALNLHRFVAETFSGRISAAHVHLRRRLARDLGRVVARMHAFGFASRDLKPSNVLVSLDDGVDGDVRLTLIDFEGMRHRRRVGARLRMRDLARLARPFVDMPEVPDTDMMRFLNAYLADAGMTRAQVRAFAAGVACAIRRGRQP